MASIVSFPRDRIRVIPNGVDAERFMPQPDIRGDLRRQLGLPASGLLVGMVARLVPVKNHHGALEALAELVHARGTQISLALAGDGPLRGELQQAANQLRVGERVHFLGDISNIDQFLNSLDLFVLNSHSEGMSNTVLEAMACGLPVIATAVGSNCDLVVHGQTGTVIPPDDPAALARAIAALAASDALRKSMGMMGRDRIEKVYGINKMVQAYSELYHDLRAKTTPGLVARTATQCTQCP
jgi:glycosyltransferase involved in cell wall biosynthesis